MDAALNFAEDAALKEAEEKATSAGARQVNLSAERRVNLVELGGGKTLFIEAQIHGLASGGF